MKIDNYLISRFLCNKIGKQKFYFVVSKLFE